MLDLRYVIWFPDGNIIKRYLIKERILHWRRLFGKRLKDDIDLFKGEQRPACKPFGNSPAFDLVRFVPRREFGIVLKQKLQSARDYLVVRGAAESAIGPQFVLHLGFDRGFDLRLRLLFIYLNNWHVKLLRNSSAVLRGATSEAGYGHAALGGGGVAPRSTA